MDYLRFSNGEHWYAIEATVNHEAHEGHEEHEEAAVGQICIEFYASRALTAELFLVFFVSLVSLVIQPEPCTISAIKASRGGVSISEPIGLLRFSMQASK